MAFGVFVFLKAVIYFDNYFTKVGTWFNIVHCFISNGKFQGYLVISCYVAHWKRLQSDDEEIFLGALIRFLKLPAGLQ